MPGVKEEPYSGSERGTGNRASEIRPGFGVRYQARPVPAQPVPEHGSTEVAEGTWAVSRAAPLADNCGTRGQPAHRAAAQPAPRCTASSPPRRTRLPPVSPRTSGRQRSAGGAKSRAPPSGSTHSSGAPLGNAHPTDALTDAPLQFHLLPAAACLIIS